MIKKSIALLLLISSNFTVFAQYNKHIYYTFPTVIVPQKQSHEPFSREWLYNVARQEGFELYKEVKENRQYYIGLLEGHVRKLNQNLHDPKKRLSLKKLARSAFFFLGAAIIFGQTKLNRALKTLKKGKLTESLMYMILYSSIFITGATGVSYLAKGLNNYREIRKRLDRDRCILDILKSTEIESQDIN